MGGQQPGAVVVGVDGVGAALPPHGDPVLARDLPSLVAALSPDTRWVTWSAAAVAPLVTAGARLDRTWDVAEAHRLAHGGWAAGPELAWAAVRGLDPATAPAAPTAGLSSAPDKSAPAENGSLVCHTTRPLKPRSARATASCTPSITASLTVCILVLKLTTATSSPSCHMRRPSFSNTVSPWAKFSPSSGSGKRWRLYTGSAERGTQISVPRRASAASGRR